MLGDFTIQLAELEDTLLYRLANSQGDILDDIELIEGIEETKRTVDDINVKTIEAKETEKNISVAREVYRPVAGRGSLIYFLIDDLGFADFPLDGDGGEGGSSSMTPSMDGLSRDGVRLTRFYTHSMCTASRASLLTGRYAFRLGLQHWVLTKESEWALPASEITLAERLRDVGYSCHILGKW